MSFLDDLFKNNTTNTQYGFDVTNSGYIDPFQIGPNGEQLPISQISQESIPSQGIKIPVLNDVVDTNEYQSLSLSPIVTPNVSSIEIPKVIAPQSNTDLTKSKNTQLMLSNLNLSPMFRKEQAVTAAQAQQPFSPDSNDDELLNAQRDRDKTLGFMAMLKGAEKIGSSLSGTRSDPDYANFLKDMAGTKVGDLLTKRDQTEKKIEKEIRAFTFANAKDKDDPNSPSSKFYRDTLTGLTKESGINLNIPDNLSAGDMEKVYPNIINIINAKEARLSKSENTKLMRSAKEETETNKKELKTNELAHRMMEDLDPNKARGGNLAANQKIVDTADRLTGLYTESNGDLRNLDSRQMEEFSLGLARLLSGTGGSSRAQVEALIPPRTLQAGAQGIKEWLTNNPQGTNQLKFVSRMAETVQRERSISADKVKKSQIQRLAAHETLKKQAPEQYQQILNSYNINSEDLEKKSNQLSKPPIGQFPKTIYNTRTRQSAVVQNAQEEKEANAEGFK